jgi:PKD repeat protein
LVLNSLDTVLLSCNGDIDGSLTVAATGGVSSYSYTWFSGVTGATALNLAAGLYTAYVEDLNGCSDSLLIQLDEPLGLVAQINSQIDISCFEGSNGLVDMGISGGVAPYVFQWTNGETTEDLNGVPAGAYTLTVTDANFCQTQVTAVVNEPTELVLGIDSLVDVTCTGMATGQAWISATGGIEPYTYLWSTGQQTSFVIGLSAGIHQVTVTDSHACSQVISIEIAEPPMIFANLIYISDVGCNGASNGSSIVEVVGGAAPYTYHWSNGDILNLTDSLTGGNQFVVVTDANGCDTTINFIMDEPDVLSVVSALAQDPTCFGDSSGLIQISITGGSEPYYPLWEDGLTTLQADGFGAGDYLVIVTDFNGCEDSLTVTLDEPTQLEIFDMVVIEPLCSGSEDGSAAVIVQGGSAPYFYDWQPSGSTSATPNDLGAGDHIVVITDQHNCLLSHTVSMNPPDLLLALAIEDTAVCPGDAALVWAEATGGVGNYFYLWNQGLGIAQGGEVIPGGTTDYIVTVTDSAGCSSIPDTMTVTLASLPTPSFIYTSPDFCAYPVQLDLENTTAGGETFEWFFGNGDVSDLQNPSISYDDPGIYTITLIAYSDIGCADTTFLTYETSEIPAASFSLDGMEGCSPVIINFQNFSENANTYLWDFGDGSTSVLPDPSHVYDNSGEYDITLVISTPGGCLDTMMLGAGVTVWQSPIADFNPIMMNPDSGAVYQFINLSSGAASYEWDFSNGVSSNLEEPYHDFLINGNFDVLLIAINEFGCIDTALHVVEINVFTGLNVPSALSAGELGETGVFLPKGTGLVQYQAMVFDEWGNLMWESKELENGSPAEGWDGTFKGKRVPQGAYIWKIDAEFFNGHVWEGKEYGREKYRNTGSVSVIY